MSPLVSGITTSARAVWRRLTGARDGVDAPAPVLEPRQAYELWAPTYGSPLTALQELEAGGRERVLPDARGLRVLDIGCGTGRVAREALESGARAVVGMDPSVPMLARAAAETADGRAAWVAAEAARLPFRAESFDAVVCALVLGHVPELGPALGEAARVTRPGGWMVITEFHPRATQRGWERTFTDGRTGRRYSVAQQGHVLEDYFRALREAGFTIDALAEPRYTGTPVVLALRARKESAQ